MDDDNALITRAYSAFNTRDIDAALALMTEDVSWPKASEGGKVTGKAAIRDYWTRQWSQFNPHVEPTAITQRDSNTAEVRVHQLVKSLAGETLFDGEVIHIHTLHDGLIQSMDLLQEGEAANEGPTAAFARHGT
jgi:hypothetical protein